MSINVQNWVWQNSETNGNDRLVLLAIADEADDDGSSAYPSMERLALKCRVNRATVMRTIRRLEEAGEIIVDRPEEYGRGRYNVYLVVMGRDGLSVADCQPLPKSRDTPKQRRERARNSAEGRAQVQPDPLTLVPVDPESTATPLVDCSDDVATVFDAWREATNHQRAVLDPKRRSKITNALKRFGVDELIDAVRGWRHSPYHCGENDNGTVYNDLDLLLRDAKHVEQFRDWEQGMNRPTPRGQRAGKGPVLSKSFQNVEAVFNGMRANQGEIG